jgi:hypothetical protein
MHPSILREYEMKLHPETNQINKATGWASGAYLVAALSAIAPSITHAHQPPPPCHPNSNAGADRAAVLGRGDVGPLPPPLQDRLGSLAERPHTFLPAQIFAEADKPSQVFQYYLLDSQGFEPNVFTSQISGVNDKAMLTAGGANCGLPTIGAVRLALEPKPGLPTDPKEIEAFIDVFTDISGLFVINNESGWYEGWMIHDLRVPDVAQAHADGHPQFGTITASDAAALRQMGSGRNTPGKIFTMDGEAVRSPSASDHFPDRQTNVVPIQLSMGAFNCMQQSDCHNYWEFNYTTNWIHPLYELPFTGGIFGTFEAGKVGALSSLIPGSGPSGVKNDPMRYGDNPNTTGVLGGSGPRDPDKFEADVDSQREFRQRFIPSGLANEILLDTFARPSSFEPGVSFPKRLNDAYAIEVKRVDTNGDGVISALEGDVDTASDGFKDNKRLFLPPTSFNRFAVTREINDGLLAPRFAPSQRAWVLTGTLKSVQSTSASAGHDGDDR